jgi:hypothetical protein
MILSFHHVREAIASGFIGFYFIPGDENPTDILSKHCKGRKGNISGKKGVLRCC